MAHSRHATQDSLVRCRSLLLGMEHMAAIAIRFNALYSRSTEMPIPLALARSLSLSLSLSRTPPCLELLTPLGTKTYEPPVP